MSAAEFEEWFDYYQEQPFGSKRDNMHAAIITAMLRNIFRATGTKPVDWKDFLFVHAEEHRESALANAFKSLVAAAVPKKQLKKDAKRRRKRDRSRKTSRKARS